MKKTTSHGFTLIETMVAVTILALSVAGPLFTASRVLVATEISRDKLIASYFAQEGIEKVRATRDDAYLAAYYRTPTPGTDTSSAWNDFLAPLGTVTVSYTPEASQTSFTRTVVPFVSSPTDEKITSTVAWDFHGTTYTVIITDHLTPWQ
jgi:prepilin-type N-terminal cleavage/methylation domain-containing protein